MDLYNIIIGLILLLLGILSSVMIFGYKSKNGLNPKNRVTINYSDYWLYSAAIGGIIGGLIVLFREFIKL